MKTLLLTLALAHGADVASTCAALARPGVVEANPMLPRSCGGIAAVNAAGYVGLALLVAKVHQLSPKWATAITVGVAGTKGVAVGLNLRTGRK